MVKSVKIGVAVGFVIILGLLVKLYREKLHHFCIEDFQIERSCLVSEQEEFVSEDVWNHFMSTFKADEPDHQDFCVSTLKGEREGSRGSQWSQDFFLARNVFAAKIVRGEPGFFVESGANYPRDVFALR